MLPRVTRGCCLARRAETSGRGSVRLPGYAQRLAAWVISVCCDSLVDEPSDGGKGAAPRKPQDPEEFRVDRALIVKMISGRISVNAFGRLLTGLREHILQVAASPCVLAACMPRVCCAVLLCTALYRAVRRCDV